MTQMRNPSRSRCHWICGFVRRVLLSSTLFTASGVLGTTNTGLGRIPPLRPPRGELPETFWEAHGTTSGIAGVLLLLVVVSLVWLVRRPKPETSLPPQEQARRALELFRNRPEDGLVLSQVSQIVHRYVAAAFDLPREELTTTEFCQLLQFHEAVGQELSDKLSHFLRRCDAKKFAPKPAAEPIGAVAEAMKFIDLAEARLASLRRTEPSPVQPK